MSKTDTRRGVRARRGNTLAAALLALVMLSGGCPRGGGTVSTGGGEKAAVRQTGPIASLSETRIFSAVAFHAGQHYAATPTGLLRFSIKPSGDAVSEPVAGLPGEEVMGLSAGSSSGLWAMTDRGLAHLEKDKWTLTDVPRVIGRPTSALLATRDDLWVGGAQGVARLKDGKWKTFLPGARISYLMEDMAGGGVWIGTDGEGIYRFKPGQGENLEAHNAARGQVIRRVRCMSFTTDGGLMAVGESDSGERMTFFDGRFWSNYKGSPRGAFNWVQMVGKDLLLSHGGQVMRLRRMTPQVKRPGEQDDGTRVGPLDLDGEASSDAPFNYPTPEFFSEELDQYLPAEATAVVGYARHILVGTTSLGMAMYDGREVTWFRTNDLVGDNERLRMVCRGDVCYLPGAGGKAWRYTARGFSELKVTDDPGARVQGFLESDTGAVISVHVPGGRQSLVVSSLVADQFLPLYETSFNYPAGMLEVRFLRLGPDGNIWAGLWYSDTEASRQPWGVVVLKKPPEVSDLPPPSEEAPPDPGGKPPEGAASTGGTAAQPPSAAAQPAGGGAPAEAAGGGATAGESPPQGEARPAGSPSAAREIAQEPVVTFHRNTLLPDEVRPANSLALPDDVRDVWFEGEFIWLATDLGIVRVKGSEIREHNENDGMASELSYAVTRSSAGELLAATFSGVGRLVGTKWYFDFTGPMGKTTHAFLTDRDTLWAGTSDGLVSRGGGENRHIRQLDGLASDLVRDLYLHIPPSGPHYMWVLTDLGVSIVTLDNQ